MADEKPPVPTRMEFKLNATRSMARLAINSLELAVEASLKSRTADWLYDASTRITQAIEILESD